MATQARDQKVGRCYLTSAPEPIYTAVGKCLLKVWVNSKLYTDEQAKDATVTLVGFDQEHLNVFNGVFLPFNQPIDFQLDAGETLYGVTFNEALVGYSVIDFAGKVKVDDE